MVCVPCFIIPVLLWLWHRFIQPILLKYWNPWEKKDAEGKVIEPEFPFKCAGGQCPFPKKQENENNKNDNETDKSKSDSESNQASDIPKNPIIVNDKKEN